MALRRSQSHNFFYESQLKESSVRIQKLTDRCVDKFKDNMLNDLNEKLDKGGSNEGLVNELKDFMRDKYDWLENFCLVYNDMYGPEKHSTGGFRVESLHRNGKCGIVYYRTKAEPPRFSDKIYHDAAQKLNEINCGNSWEGYKTILGKLFEDAIGCDGCAVIRIGHDLRLASTFSTKYVTATGNNATSIILLQ